ncbi:MAG: hypothetical protein FWD33_02015 [Alphaproteobacteria bacterium]|nr:hypothetical protein [Alphaproteobacteria bacterium]
MSKKIIISALAAVAAISAGSAAAAPSVDKYNVSQSVFNPTYRPAQGDWGVQAGFNFQTGSNDDFSSQTKFSTGEFQVGDFRAVYGIMDELFVSLDVYSNTFNPYVGNFYNGKFANPEIGLNWQIVRPAKSFAVDLIGKYGAAWTRDAVTNDRIGMNNLQAGLRIYGDEGMFQWGAQSLAQLGFRPAGVISDSDRMWNLLSRVEAEFEIVKKVGLRGEFNFNVYNLDRNSGELTFYDMNTTLGLIYDLAPGAAIQPYVAYHLRTSHSGGIGGAPLPNDFWQFGAKVGVQF